ncbi:MAG TPA: cysteine desulfurase family protein [Hyphomicrobiaceae bacterium]|nr:cysteine desulfurase family protein [Hyphomicrobiaceae bacterium]
MIAALDLVGNPSSPHADGRRARAVIEDAREQVAALVNANPAEVVFTSGGTEANNAVLAAGWDAIIASGLEHDSVLAPARRGGARFIEMAAGRDGVVLAETFSSDVAQAAGRLGRVLVSLQFANNVTGAVQPVAEVAAVAKASGLAVHTDAVQAVGRLPVDAAALGVDFLTLSAHKLGGPKGVGAVVMREPASLPAFVTGGGQERRRRAGTENVAAIAGFGAAAQAARRERQAMERVRALRNSLEAGVRAATPDVIVIAGGTERLPNTSCLAVSGLSAETVVIALDLKGIAVSAGAACSSGKVGASHVLEAMGLEPQVARAAVRVSLGPQSKEADVAAFLEAWTDVVARRRERAVA